MNANSFEDYKKTNWIDHDKETEKKQAKMDKEEKKELKMFVIRILNSNKPCWITDDDVGDPPRTLLLENAQRFDRVLDAEDRILAVRKTHPFRSVSYEIEGYKKTHDKITKKNAKANIQH